MNPTRIETQRGGETISAPGEIERSSEVETAGGIASAAARPAPQYLLCEHCQAPVDRDQRYCVVCGARQSHVRNPATTYFATAARSRRTGGSRQRPEGGLRGPLFALLLVLLPLAVAIGVLVGKSGGSSNDGKLISALQKQQPVVAAPGTATTASAASAGASSGSLPSDFALSRGFTVRVATLPVNGTDQAAVKRAEQEARTKGATGKVGLINPKELKVTPSQGASNYVIYSGEFKTRAQAQTALAKLKAHFAGAQVIEVAPLASAAAPPVVAHTAYGTVHQIAGSHATRQEIQQDKKVVQQINRTVGKNYVQAQKNLPDTITVTGGGESSGSNQSAAEKLGEH